MCQFSCGCVSVQLVVIGERVSVQLRVCVSGDW